VKARDKKWLLGGLLALGAVWYLWPKSAKTTPRPPQTGSSATLIPSDMVVKRTPAPPQELLIKFGKEGNGKLVNLMMLASEVGRLDTLARVVWGHGLRPLPQPK
jgi:hypothetical protein